MATNSIIKPDAVFTEAPASWNTRYVTPEGFACQITIRGESGRDLLEKAGVALSFLLEHGYKPEDTHRPIRNNATASKSGKWCELHECELKRFEKDGKIWFSHKASDGSWCRGKQKGS
ncbi:MAG: hypothetical protein MHPDNHAH_02826 [Anaerolineales bacterium]|nr:hypothetical protein [Anaerolineales bacterium]